MSIAFILIYFREIDMFFRFYVKNIDKAPIIINKYK